MLRPDFLRDRLTTDDQWVYKAISVLVKLGVEDARHLADWLRAGDPLTSRQILMARSLCLRHVDRLAQVCSPSPRSPHAVTLKTLEASYAAILNRPVAYPYRPGTIPAATKKRKLKYLARYIAALRQKLGVPV